jgi:LacI family transcriptional regulator
MNLKELSERLGLSQTTVSRALNGYPEVSEATRTRVLAAAQEHNYQPSQRAKSLATGRSMSIGHVIPVSSEHEIVNPVFSDFIAGASEVYSTNGYDLSLTTVRDDDQARVYAELAARGAVDGVVLHAPRVNDDRIRLLQDIGLPFVVHGRSSDVTLNYSWLDVDNRRAFGRATDFLIDLGHRRIALINGVETLDFAARRREGYLWALKKRKVARDRTIMQSGEMTEALGYEQTRRLMESPAPPTAILASSMIIAFGVNRALADMGLTMPRDVSVIAFDDDLSYFRNGGVVPVFTSLRSSVRQAGRRIAAMLLDRITRPQAPSSHEMLEAEFVIGQSTGPVPVAARRVGRRA